MDRKEFLVLISLIVVIVGGIFILPAYALYSEGLKEFGVSFWKVQLGWGTMVIAMMFVLQEKPSQRTGGKDA